MTKDPNDSPFGIIGGNVVISKNNKLHIGWPKINGLESNPITICRWVTDFKPVNIFVKQSI